MDVEEINRLLHKIEHCLRNIIITLENKIDFENEYYNKFEELIETTVNEMLNKITNLRIDSELYKLNNFK